MVQIEKQQYSSLYPELVFIAPMGRNPQPAVPGTAWSSDLSSAIHFLYKIAF